jgi:drug/metabolite transporter (DMT)-like permease
MTTLASVRQVSVVSQKGSAGLITSGCREWHNRFSITFCITITTLSFRLRQKLSDPLIESKKTNVLAGPFILICSRHSLIRKIRFIPSQSTWAVAALLAGATAIGAAPIFVRLSEVDPVSTAFYRLAFAQPFLWAMFRRHRQQKIHDPANGPTKPALLLLIIAGIFFALDMAAWNVAINLTTVANATLLANTAPFFVAIGAFVIFKEKVGRTFVVGLLIGILGMVALSGASWSQGNRSLSGDAMALLTAVFYAAYQLSVKKLRSEIAVWELLAVSGLSATVVLALIALPTETNLIPTTAKGWLTLFLYAVFCQVLGQGLIVYGFAHLRASFSSLTLLFQPIVATSLAWALLSEPIGLAQGFGGALVLCGILVARHSDRIDRS